MGLPLGLPGQTSADLLRGFAAQRSLKQVASLGKNTF